MQQFLTFRSLNACFSPSVFVFRYHSEIKQGSHQLILLGALQMKRRASQFQLG